MNDTNTNTVTQILTAINIVIRELSSRMEWAANIRDGFIRTTSGRMQYALEPDFHSLQGKFFIEEDTQRLETMSTDEFNHYIPNPDAGAQIPKVAMLPETFPVRQQPATKVRGVSDSASDTQKATIYGETYGIVTSETITLAGATGVLTTKEFTWVHRIELASAAVGTVTFTANASSSDTTLPTVAAAGDFTVGTVAIAATKSTNTIGPAGHIRLNMTGVDTAADQSKDVRIEGYTVDTTNVRDRLFVRETLATGADSTDVVKSTNKFSEVLSIQKSWDSTNTLIVGTDPNATIVAEIGPDRRSITYQQARFFNVPDGKSILYRYVPQVVKMAHNDDEPALPELYHQMVAEWSEKVVRGWHGDFTRGIRTLQNNPEFDRAVLEARRGSRPESSSSIVLGGGWRRDVRQQNIVLPITPA